MTIVKYCFYNLDREIEHCKQVFENDDEGLKFYNHIKETTDEMLKKYGKLGNYNPYFAIQIIQKEIKNGRRKNS